MKSLSVKFFNSFITYFAMLLFIACYLLLQGMLKNQY